MWRQAAPCRSSRSAGLDPPTRCDVSSRSPALRGEREKTGRLDMSVASPSDAHAPNALLPVDCRTCATAVGVVVCHKNVANMDLGRHMCTDRAWGAEKVKGAQKQNRHKHVRERERETR